MSKQRTCKTVHFKLKFTHIKKYLCYSFPANGLIHDFMWQLGILGEAIDYV